MTVRPHILPDNTTPLEREVDQTLPAWGPLADAFKTPSEGEPLEFMPWYAAEYGLADFADHFPDAGQLVRAGIPWLLERGTAAAVVRAMGWMGLDTATLDEDGAYLHIDIGRPASDAELLAVARLVRPSIPAHVRFYRVFHDWDLRHARADHSRWDGALWDNCSGVWVNTDTGQLIKASFGHTRATIDPLPTLQPLADDGRTQIHTDLAQRPDTYTWDSWRWDNPVQLLDVYEGIAAIDTRSTTAPPALPAIGYTPGHHGHYSGDTTTAAAQPPISSATATQSATTDQPHPRRGWTGAWDATPWRPAFPSQEPTLMQQAMAALRRNGGSIWMPYESQFGFGNHNLLSNPENIAAWQDRAPGTVGTNVTAAPDGTWTADSFTKTAASSTWCDLGHYASVGVGGNVGKTYTYSEWLWVPSGTLTVYQAISDRNYNTVNSNSFTVTTTPTRRTFTTTGPAGGWNANGAAIGAGLQITRTGSPLYAWGRKLEIGDTATDYTPESILATLGSYSDSAGTQSLSVVGDLIGLVMDKSTAMVPSDANMATGPWVNTFTTAFDTFASAGPSGFTATTTGAKTGIRVGIPCSFATNKLYRFEFKLTFTNVSNASIWFSDYSLSGITAVQGTATFVSGTTFRVHGISSATSTHLMLLFTTSAAATVELTGFKAQEMPGTHATQTTTTNKPGTARVPKRLGAEIAPDASAVLTGEASRISAGVYRIYSGTGTLAAVDWPGVLVAGKSYRVDLTVDRIDVAGAGVSIDMNGISVATFTTTGKKSFVVAATFTQVRIKRQSGTTDIQISGVSIREVLEWQPAMSFDGSNDYLQTTLTPGTTGWMCAALRHDTATTAYPMAAGGLTDGSAGANLRLVNGTAPQIQLGDGTARQYLQADAAVSPGIPFVYDGGWDSTTVLIGVNGVEKTAARTRNPAGAATTLTLGSAAGVSPMNGPAVAFVYCAKLPNATDRALIRRLVGSLQGQSL